MNENLSKICKKNHFQIDKSEDSLEQAVQVKSKDFRDEQRVNDQFVDSITKDISKNINLKSKLQVKNNEVLIFKIPKKQNFKVFASFESEEMESAMQSTSNMLKSTPNIEDNINIVVTNLHDRNLNKQKLSHNSCKRNKIIRNENCFKNNSVCKLKNKNNKGNNTCQDKNYISPRVNKITFQHSKNEQNCKKTTKTKIFNKLEFKSRRDFIAIKKNNKIYQRKKQRKDIPGNFHSTDFLNKIPNSNHSYKLF